MRRKCTTDLSTCPSRENTDTSGSDISLCACRWKRQKASAEKLPDFFWYLSGFSASGGLGEKISEKADKNAIGC